MIRKSQFADSFTAGEDFDADDLYKAVKIDSAGTSDSEMQVEQCGAGEHAVGILQTFATTGHAVRVAHTGTTKGRVGAAVTVNASLKTDANGKLIPVTSNNDKVVARAFSAAAAEDEIILVKLVDMVHGA